MNVKSLILGIIGIAIGVFMLFLYYQSYSLDARRNQTIYGKLDREYTEITTTRRGTKSISYEVTYRFSINGVEYSGQDTLNLKPFSDKVMVFYDPQNPANNKLRPGADRTPLIIGGIVIIVSGVVLRNAFNKSARGGGTEHQAYGKQMRT